MYLAVAELQMISNCGNILGRVYDTMLTIGDTNDSDSGQSLNIILGDGFTIIAKSHQGKYVIVKSGTRK